jgi:hypothetical protein
MTNIGRTRIPQEFFNIDYAELGKRSIRTLFFVQQRIDQINEELEKDEHKEKVRYERDILRWVLAHYAVKPRSVPEIEAIGYQWPHVED